MRHLWRGLRWFLSAVVGLALLYVATAFILNAIQRPASPLGPGSYRYFACDNGVHVDIVLPVVGGGRDWRTYFPPADFAGDVRGASHVSLGWGAEGFFANTPRWQDIRPIPVVKALSWLDSSVLHVSYHGDPTGLPQCRALLTDSAGRARLFAFIDATTEGRPRRVPLPGYGTGDAFYAASGRYSLLRTCNVWSAEALQAAGIPMGLWSPFSFQVMSSLSQVETD